jgi:drug/metabolite transporter (DMT)-like permease
MPLAAVVLVLGAAVCHSVWNLIVKSEPRPITVQSGALAIGVLLASPVLAFHSLRDLSGTAWLLVALSALFETGYVFALSRAYEVGDLSQVYPIARGTAPIVVTPLAIVLFGEEPSLAGAIGIALVVLGIYGSHAGSLRAWSAGSRQALGLALLSGTMTAGYSLVNRVGVRAMPIAVYAFLVFALNVAMVQIVFALRGSWRPPLSRDLPWARTVIVAALMLGAYLAVLTAMSLAPVSYVVAGREVSIVVATLLGIAVLRERPPPVRLVGAAMIFSGLVVIALSR